MVFDIFQLLSSVILLLNARSTTAGNIALRQPTEISSVYDDNPSPAARLAVDGNPMADHPYGAVTKTSTNPWWRVDLGMSYVIDDVYIIGRKVTYCCYKKINGAVITVGENIDGTLNAKCTTIEGVTAPLSKSFKCSAPLRGRYLTIYIPGERKLLALYEVMVNENPTANLAKGKTAMQSTQYLQHVAELAVDGNRDGMNQHCTHTIYETNPWWRVDLGASFPVSEIFIVNRDKVQERLVNIEIRVGDSLADNGTSNPLCGSGYSMATLYKSSFYCKPRKTGRYVTIVLAGQRMVLTLCEVEVYSESKAVLRNKPPRPSTLNLIESLPATIKCPESFGYPVPYVAWFQDGVLVKNNTNDELIIDNKTLINRRNDSVWECVVTNIYGSDFHQFLVQGSFKMCAKYKDLSVKEWSVNVKTSSLSNNSSIINDDTWYRLTDGNKYLQLPEWCVSPMHCSTQATGWMQGSHPRKQDLVVERTVCFSWNNNCCRNKTTILVRRCHGYYVYKLKKTALGIQSGNCTVHSSPEDESIMFESGPSGHALLNHVINTETGLTVIECISVCLSHPSCRSVNHDATTQLCEMNNATRHFSFDQDWSSRSGNQYHEISESTSVLIL